MPVTHRHRLAFTLIELMVSISILIVIILGVGVTFSGASKSVGDSNAIMEMMSSVRAVGAMMEQDISNVDKSCFLVIRSRIDDSQPFSIYSRHFDQFSCVENGTFPNRTGANTVTPFQDNTVANSALVWYGHAVFEKIGALPDQSYLVAKQDLKPPMGIAQPPTGYYDPGTGAVVKEGELTLARHATLLVSGSRDAQANVYPAGTPVAAYASPDYLTGAITGFDGLVADITSSRYSVAAMTSSQLMAELVGFRLAGDPSAEANHYCYRFKALASVYDGEAANFVNGCFRMHPIAVKGISSFKVEWTNGEVYGQFDADGPPQAVWGQTRWFGAQSDLSSLTKPFELLHPGVLPPGTERYGGSPTTTANVYGDHYIATFSYFNRAYWPKALRISMHVTDPANRLKGGRDFVQVVKLPE